ncbi:MAG: UDP-3-O-(3-hydroxymyristoyl)glucosamine N-acyltransferase [Pseudomonadota bacterium]|nr:UDP-3-O-(3-hydroxymyristoyl)glucosamine N-acyltransferase [Pseudomonadota bacterium]
MPSLTLADLRARLGGTIRGNADIPLHGAASLEQAGAGQLGYLLNRKFLDQARASAAGALIVPASLEQSLSDTLPQSCLAVDNPHATFARALALLYPESPQAPGIHPTAVIAADCVIDATAHIGPGCVVETGARIGARCVIGPHCVIGAGVQLGDDCHLHAQVTVQHGCIIGNRVVLHPGCVIGSDGFGLAWEGDGWLKVPQVGRAILGDDVEVGANTSIDRGALDDTVIEDGVKLDNLIQIAHNCRIGRHTAIAACVGIAGSTRIGAYCQIGGAAMIIGHLEIADRVTVSAGTFVAKDIREAGVYTSVQPLMRHADWLRNASHLRHLDDLARRIKSLEKQLEQP